MNSLTRYFGPQGSEAAPVDTKPTMKNATMYVKSTSKDPASQNADARRMNE